MENSLSQLFDRNSVDFLKKVRPKRISTLPLNGIVTNRLERHSSADRSWLARHGIEFGKRIMSPYAAFSERDRANDSARRKANTYAADPTLRLFIESDDQQAIRTARVLKPTRQLV